MGKYVLVEFDDDAQADNLIARINAAELGGKRFRIAGIFARPPKKRCECIGVKAGGRLGGVKRHRATGFWFCTKCKRVRRGPQDPRNQLDPQSVTRAQAALCKLNEGAALHFDRQGGMIANYPLTEAIKRR